MALPWASCCPCNPLSCFCFAGLPHTPVMLFRGQLQDQNEWSTKRIFCSCLHVPTKWTHVRNHHQPFWTKEENLGPFGDGERDKAVLSVCTDAWLPVFKCAPTISSHSPHLFTFQFPQIHCCAQLANCVTAKGPEEEIFSSTKWAFTLPLHFLPC